MGKRTSKPSIDWDALEWQYRAGIRSLKDIGAEFGVSDAGILKRAKRDGWARDLTAKIRAKAEAKVSALAVSELVSAGKKVSEQQTIDSAANAIVTVKLSHRTDIQRARNLTMSLLAELEGQTNNLDLYNQLAELMYEPDEKGQDKRNDLFNKVISLSSRTGTMKSLADSIKTLVTLERESYNMVEASKVEVTGKNGGAIVTIHEMSDEALLQIASGSAK